MPSAREPSRRRASPDSHEADEPLAARLGPGMPLDAATRSRMERAFGHDFSRVRVHADEPAHRLATMEGAVAFAVGDHVGFRRDAPRPGTPLGDGLLAHELAHVVQQQGATGPVARGHDGAVEHDAHRAAVEAVGTLHGRGGPGRAKPRVRGSRRLSLAICSVERTEPPAYLGPESRAALAEIERISGSADLLGPLIVFGTAVTMGTAGPEENAATLGTGGPDLSPHAAALQAVPVIKWSRIGDVIDLLLLSHENDMNEQERAFWHRMRERVEQMRQHANANFRRRP